MDALQFAVGGGDGGNHGGAVAHVHRLAVVVRPIGQGGVVAQHLGIIGRQG